LGLCSENDFDLMMIVLAIEYGLIVLAAMHERNWWRALYFVGAILITVAILRMGHSVVRPD